MLKPAVAFIIAMALTETASAVDQSSANYVMPGCRSIISGDDGDNWHAGLCAGIVTGLSYGGMAAFTAGRRNQRSCR